jgi:hypothetical protein
MWTSATSALFTMLYVFTGAAEPAYRGEIDSHSNGLSRYDECMYLQATNYFVISNVKETVVTVTNVVETTNERGCTTCKQLQDNPYILIYHPWHFGGLPYIPPTEKLTTTTIKEVYSITFDWREHTYTQIDEVVLSTSYKYETRKTKI